MELVDITPEALRRRLSHGNIYAFDKVDAALENFFRRGNLTALRELSLLWIADQVDAALVQYRNDNRITDLTPLAGLRKLRGLDLSDNSSADVLNCHLEIQHK